MPLIAHPGQGMRRLARLLAVSGPAVLAACIATDPAGPADRHALRRSIDGPTLIAFAPPQAAEAAYEGAAEGVAHLRFALADVRRCLGAKRVHIETIHADRLTLDDRQRRQTFELRKLGQGFGAVLVEPGRDAIEVHSEVGPSSLQHQLPQAAFDYWKIDACRRQ